MLWLSGCLSVMKIVNQISTRKVLVVLNVSDLISNEKKQKLKERNKQIEIAKRKGIYNPYIKYTPSNFY